MSISHKCDNVFHINITQSTLVFIDIYEVLESKAVIQAIQQNKSTSGALLVCIPLAMLFFLCVFVLCFL